MGSKILFIDDNEENLNSTGSLLEEWGYVVDRAHGGQNGLIKGTDTDYAIILTDYRMPGMSGLEVVRELKKVNKESILVMYSCDDTKLATKNSWDAGAATFIEKNTSPPQFKAKIEELCNQYHTTRRVLRDEMTPSAREELIASVGMIGRSKQSAEIARTIKKYRENRYSVLIIGETGVGKELIAQALHSGPKDKYKSINCATFKSSNLLENELFGSEKGGFTGATGRIGIIEAANGGTVFFDELHELDLDAQAKLLRTFQEKTIKRVGGRDEYEVNFRIIAATQPDIEQRVANKEFKPDLYNRLNVLQIVVPPLRERPEDIEPLVRHFCNLHFKKWGERKYFLAETIRMFENHHWSGNIRVLENTVNRLLVNVSDEVILPKHLNPAIFNTTGPETTVFNYSLFKKRQEDEMRDYLQRILKSCNFNALEAADIIKIAPSTLYDLIRKLKIRNEKESREIGSLKLGIQV